MFLLLRLFPSSQQLFCGGDVFSILSPSLGKLRVVCYIEHHTLENAPGNPLLSSPATIGSPHQLQLETNVLSTFSHTPLARSVDVFIAFPLNVRRPINSFFPRMLLLLACSTFFDFSPPAGFRVLVNSSHLRASSGRHVVPPLSTTGFAVFSTRFLPVAVNLRHLFPHRSDLLFCRRIRMSISLLGVLYVHQVIYTFYSTT